MDPQTAANHLKNQTTWQRLVFMVLFAVILHVVDLILVVFIVVQFLFRAVSGRLFDNAAPFAQSLSTYIYEIFRFLTFRTDVMPWPFAPWPDGSPIDDGSEQPSLDLAADATAAQPRARCRGPRPTGEQPTT
ncbi:MAG: DUF4389 domain-containing protein [Alphaproteobacteria bacterium]|nr:DUF4389 domain-containing protein [Alphaproteobacteria bacterium]